VLALPKDIQSKPFYKVKRKSVYRKTPILGISVNVLSKDPIPQLKTDQRRPSHMLKKLRNVLSTVVSNEEGQDIAEYAVMLAVILVLVIGTVRLIGANANSAFSTVASTLS
jgi:Flp pilus assembly pilin Flp